MKITKLRAVGPTTVDFPIIGATPSGKFVLQNVTGLDPVDYVVLDNGVTIPQDREIVLLVGLQPQYQSGQSAESIRSELYRLLTPRPGKKLRLQLMDGNNVVAYADGQIKKFEAAHFVKDPQVQITFTCLGSTKSYLLGDEQVITPELTTWAGGTEFAVNNIGTADASFAMAMKLTSPVTVGGYNPNLGELGIWGLLVRLNQDENNGTDYIKFPGIEMAINDTLMIDTRFGSKALTYDATGPTEKRSLIYAMTPKSRWLTLQPGPNVFRVSETFVWATAEYGFAFRYTPAYLGV